MSNCITVCIGNSVHVGVRVNVVTLLCIVYSINDGDRGGVKKTGSRYALVIETAKRTRQLVEGAQKLSDVRTSKDVTVAVNEIYENKIEAVSTKEKAAMAKPVSLEEQPEI